jgi:glycosyltransferase involved in cell wall biosynthesis
MAKLFGERANGFWGKGRDRQVGGPSVIRIQFDFDQVPAVRIIFANRYFYPDQSATSRMLTSLAFALAGEGAQVTAIACRRLHDRQDLVLPKSETVSGVEIRRLAGSGFGRSTVVGRAADYSTFHLSAAAWLTANTGPGDVCVVCTDPPLLSVTAALPLAMRGATMVNWVMDLFPEVAIELGMLAPNTMAARLGVALRDWSSRRAALNVCPTDTIARFIEERLTAPEKLAVLQHWSDGDEIFPIARADNRLRKEWGLADKFVVGYSGNFGRAHEFDTLLGAAELLKEHDQIRFLFIGSGQKRSYVEAEVGRRRLPNVLMKPLQPSERLAESLCAADLHVVSLLPQLEHCIIPSKFYGILAAGRPTLFVGDVAGEVARAVVRAKCGAAIEIGQTGALAGQIRAFRDSTELYTTACANARRLFETKHSRDRAVLAWRELMHAIEKGRVKSFGRSYPEGAT